MIPNARWSEKLKQKNQQDIQEGLLPPFVLSDPRQASQELRHYLKGLILEGVFPGGAVLSQFRLAKALGVSRTPIREALRMLHEDRLVNARSNYRATVLAPDPIELDGLYATRILLEALAYSLTIEKADDAIRKTIEDKMAAMHAAGRQSGNAVSWMRPHREFHLSLSLGAPAPLRQTIQTCLEQSERYQLMTIRVEGAAPPRLGEVEHVQIVEALRTGNAAAGAARLARHLGRVASIMMSALDPSHGLSATKLAVAMAVSAGD